MTYEECTKIYYKWERCIHGQILIDGIWKDIIDIEEDAHRGWLCKTSKGSIELSSVEFCNIQFPFEMSKTL